MKPILTILAVALVAGGVQLHAAVPETPVSELDKLRFNQDRASSHMSELEERMYQLADLIRESEPDNASRLLLALRQAREDLIIEQMKQIRSLLESGRLQDAVGGEEAVLARLMELRELLLTDDFDFRLKMEMLRRMKEALVKLEAVLQEEKRLVETTEELEASAKRNEVSPETYDLHETDQKRNRLQTESVTQAVQATPASRSQTAPALKQAAGHMAAAEAGFSSQKPGEAGSRQEEAVAALETAQGELKEAVEQLRKELAAEVRNQVLDAVAAMLEQQEAVRGSTEELGPSAGTGDAGARAGIKRLADSEQQIVARTDETVQLITDTEYSVALPLALGAARALMLRVAYDLKSGNGGPEVVQTEVRIEDALAGLLEALKELPPGAAGESGSCSSCGGTDDRSKMLSELKVLRLIQEQVNAETLEMDGQRTASEGGVDSRLRKSITRVRKQQDGVYRATMKLHSEVCSSCAAQGAF